MIRYTCDMCGKDIGGACKEVSIKRIDTNLVVADIKLYRQLHLCSSCTDKILFKIYNYKESENEQN